MIAAHLRAELARFVGILRASGVAVPGDGAVAAAEALAALDDRSKATVRTALAATLCTRPRDRDVFDAAFETFWARARGEDAAYGDGDDVATLGTDATGVADAPGQTVSDADAGEAGASGGERAGGVGASDARGAGRQYSADGESERIERGEISDVDVADAAAAFTDAVAARQGRRWTDGAGAPDVRRALRKSASTGGRILDVPERTPARDAASGVVLVDVSGSVLDHVDRSALLAFCVELRARWRDATILFFDTELRDVGAAFDAPSVAAAARALEASGVTWGGGTRIGEALATLHRERPETVDDRRAVVIVSDGVEHGDTARLRRELAWLSGRAGVVLWLNPLAANPDWRPVAPGMRAALPYLDGCYAFADAADLERLADDLRRNGPAMRAVEAARRRDA